MFCSFAIYAYTISKLFLHVFKLTCGITLYVLVWNLLFHSTSYFKILIMLIDVAHLFLVIALYDFIV